MNTNDKVMYLESAVKKCVRDMAISRDRLLSDAIRKKTNILVSKDVEKIQKFKLKDRTYIVIPVSHYENIIDLNSYEEYKYISNLIKLTLSADEYQDEDKRTEAQYIDDALKTLSKYSFQELNIKKQIEYNEFKEPVNIKGSYFDKKIFTVEEKEQEKEHQENKDKGEPENKSEPKGESEVGCNLSDVKNEVKNEKQQQQEIKHKAQYASQKLDKQQMKIVEDLENSAFNNGGRKLISLDEKKKLTKQANEIIKSLKGYKGKTKRMNPSKRINSKAICSDNTEKIYVGKSLTDGKFIDMNIVCELSGSMSGSPIQNAVKIIYLFNKIAQAGYLEGHIILTKSNNVFEVKMPVADEVIDKINYTSYAEGIAEGMDKHTNILRNKNVIVITDSDICEKPIPDDFWDKHRINAIGMYINESVKNEELVGYDKNMYRWFKKVIIRNSFDDAINKIIHLGLKASKG